MSNNIPHIGIERRGKHNPAKAPEVISTRRMMKRVLEQARPCWPHLAGIVLLSVLATPLSLLLPIPLKLVVDNVIGARPAPAILAHFLPTAWTSTPVGMLMISAGLLLAIGAVMQVQVLMSWMLQTYTGERLVHDFRARLFWHVQRLRLEFHDRTGTSDTAYRIQHDAPAIQMATIQGVVPFVTAIFSFLGMAYVTIRMDWQLAVVAFVISPALMLVSRLSSRKVQDGWQQVKEQDSSAMSVLTEVLGAVRLVKAFGRERNEDKRFESRSSVRMESQMRLALIQASYYCVTAMLITLGSVGALWIGARHVQSGVLTLGELLIVMAYMTQLYEPLRTMANKVSEVQSSLVSVNRAFALLDEVPESLAVPHARMLLRATGAVEFQNVSFVYGNGRKVLDDISFRIEPGTKVGIIGPTGSGKSTLASLLTRFYEASSGRILLDGVDVREYRLDDLRNQFAIVPQDPVLFSTSIAENIAFSHPNVSEMKIIAAAKAAHAHEFVMELPDGYDTEVGDRGSCLSGGERQRIAIARAFLKNSPIIILDEPTSAVDSRTEAAVMTATEKLLQGRTTFMIAHRLSTLESCGMLLHFNDGKLTVVGDDVKGFLRRLAAEEHHFIFDEITPANMLYSEDFAISSALQKSAAQSMN